MRFHSTFQSVLSSAALTALLLPLAGCGVTDTGVWKEGRRMYYTHVNTPAEIDLSEPNTLDAADQRLVSRMMLVDTQLSSLERMLDSLPSQPNGEMLADMLRRFPWLTNVTLLDSSGSVLGSVPSLPVKQLDYTTLLEPAPKTSPRVVRASVQDTPLGPEVLMARPLFDGTTMIGLVVATFDIRSLLPYVDNASSMIVRSPDVLVWSGDLHYNETPLASVNWAEAVLKNSYGTQGSKPQSFSWLVRYVGAIPLIFAAAE